MVDIKIRKIRRQNVDDTCPIIIGECVEYQDDDTEVRKDITYYRFRKKPRWGTEVYTGKNYIVGSSASSYSKNYVYWKGMPKKYLPIAKILQKKWKEVYG